MDNDPLPGEDNVIRHCPRKYLDEEERPTPAAFYLRHDKDEHYLSVFWLEFFADTPPGRLPKVRKDIQTARRLKKNEKLAQLNVGTCRNYVRHATDGERHITFKHKPRKNNSHSGVFELEPDDQLIAVYLCDCVDDTHPAL